MKKKLLCFIVSMFFVFSSVFTFSACKKDNTPEAEPTEDQTTVDTTYTVEKAELVSKLYEAMSNSTINLSITKSMLAPGQNEATSNSDDPGTGTIVFTTTDGQTTVYSMETGDTLYESETFTVTETQFAQYSNAILAVAEFLDEDAFTVTTTQAGGMQYKITVDLTALANKIVTNFNTNQASVYAFLNQLLKDLNVSNGIKGLLTEVLGDIQANTTLGTFLNSLKTKYDIDLETPIYMAYTAIPASAPNDEDESEEPADETPTVTWDQIKMLTAEQLLSYAGGLQFDATSGKTFGQFVVDAVDDIIKSYTEEMSLPEAIEMAEMYMAGFMNNDMKEDEYTPAPSAQQPQANEEPLDSEEPADEDSNLLEPDMNEEESEDSFEAILSFIANAAVTNAKIEATFTTNASGKLAQINLHANFAATITVDPAQSPINFAADFEANATVTGVGSTTAPTNVATDE